MITKIGFGVFNRNLTNLTCYLRQIQMRINDVARHLEQENLQKNVS